MKLTLECDCGNKVETKTTYESEFGAVAIRFEDGTTFVGDENGYVYIDCGQCGKGADVGE